jgi:hypothetical protein
MSVVADPVVMFDYSSGIDDDVTANPRTGLYQSTHADQTALPDLNSRRDASVRMDQRAPAGVWPRRIYPLPRFVQANRDMQRKIDTTGVERNGYTAERFADPFGIEFENCLKNSIESDESRGNYAGVPTGADHGASFGDVLGRVCGCSVHRCIWPLGLDSRKRRVISRPYEPEEPVRQALVERIWRSRTDRHRSRA